VVTSVLLVDIAWRRLNVADWFRRRAPAGLAVVTGTDASLGAFRAVKSGRRDVDSQRKSLRERVETLAAAQPASETPPPVAGMGFPTVEGTTPPAAPTTAATEAPAGENYANRLMSAKKRAKEQIRDQEKDGK